MVMFREPDDLNNIKLHVLRVMGLFCFEFAKNVNKIKGDLFLIINDFK